MSYRVLAPCVVRQDGGKSAVHYRQVGGVIEVDEKADADALVAGGFLEELKESRSTPKSKPGA
jgi:hypothetical protein